MACILKRLHKFVKQNTVTLMSLSSNIGELKNNLYRIFGHPPNYNYLRSVYTLNVAVARGCGALHASVFADAHE